MTDLSLRPRSATELVDAAFQIFRQEPAQFIVATAMVYVPWIVLRLFFDPTVTSSSVADVWRAVPGAIMGLAVYAIAGAVVTLLARDVYLGQRPDVASAFRHVGRRAVPLLVTSLAEFILVVVAAIFFLFPALYAITRLFALRQAVVIEDAGVGGAFSRTSELSAGMKLHVLWTLLLVVALTFTVSIGAGLVIKGIPSRVALIVISTAVSVVIYPFFAITETLLYYDVRIRKEGFDVEYLATRGAPAASADVTP